MEPIEQPSLWDLIYSHVSFSQSHVVDVMPLTLPLPEERFIAQTIPPPRPPEMAFEEFETW